MSADKSPDRDDDALARELANAALMLADVLTAVAPRLRLLIQRDWAAATTATSVRPARPIADIAGDMSAAASQRFWCKVDKAGPEDCWIWKGYVAANGYGNFNFNRRIILAHRFAYENAVGRIPPGLLIRHSCDIRNCVNPAHLTPGTYKDNADDRVRHQRQPRGEQMRCAKLDAAKVRKIRNSREPSRVLALRFGVARVTINDVRRGRTWRQVGADEPSGDP